MTPTPEVQERHRRYLLGQLADDAREEFEKDLLASDELYQELLMVEDEIVDAYLSKKLGSQDRAAFEKHFLVTPERHDKLRFGRAFNRYLSAQSPVAPERQLAISGSPWAFSRILSSPLRIGIAAVVIVGIAFGVWRVSFHQSDVEKALVALNAAYREQRPIESRITRLNYAPYFTTRGPGDEKVDQNELRLAELWLQEALKNNPTPTVRHALGKVFLAKKEFDKAIEQFNEALKGEPKNAQLYGDLGAAWLEKGRVDREGPESGKGMEELGRGQENLKKALELNPNLLEALFNRALCTQQLKLSHEAAAGWREYLKRDSTSQWADEARRNLSLLEEQEKKKFQSSEQLFQKFIAAYKARNDVEAWASLKPGRGRTGNIIVETLINNYLNLATNNRLAEAREELEKLSYAAKVESETVDDRFTSDLSVLYGAASAVQLTNLIDARNQMKAGIEHYNSAEWQKAIEFFLKARELFSQANDEAEVLFAEAWTGYCYLRIPDREQSSRIFQKLSTIFEHRRYRSLFAQSMLAQADALGPNEFSQVVDQAEKALIASVQVQDDANAIRCLQAGTSMQLKLGDYRKSMAATYRALTLAEGVAPDAKLIWPFFHETALDFYFLEMPTTALLFENEALRLAKTAQLPFQTNRSHDRLALIFERLQNYAEAMKNLEQARAEGQRISDWRARTNIIAHSALSLARVYRVSGNARQAVDSVDEALRLYQTLNLDIYQYAAHKEKFLALTALNDNRSAEEELSTVLYWFEQNRQKIAEESHRNKFFDTGQNTYDVAIDFQYSRKKDERKAFDYAEASRARSLLDLMASRSLISDADKLELKVSSGTSPLTFEEIRGRLAEQAQLLEYSVLDDKVIIWLISRNAGKTVHTDISRDLLNRKIQDYLSALTGAKRSGGEDPTNQAKDLYQILIAPVERYLNPSLQLCVVPVDSLNFLPFAALISPTSNRYLVEEYAIEMSPSATIFVTNSEEASLRAQTVTERPLVVGDPYFDRGQFPDLEYLPAAAREAEQIANLYGGVALVGESAVASRVKTALKKADIAHFATHALPDEQTPLLSKLLLAKDRESRRTHHASPGFIQASEIYAMKLPRTRLVVLSACQTGIERSYRGEGAIGLARPFIAAGVPLVVASLWPVESEDAARLMISFHKHRKQDRVSTVEALRRAQLETLHNSAPGAQKNYDWAAFEVIGGYASF